jgi:hypothetical protein
MSNTLAKGNTTIVLPGNLMPSEEWRNWSPMVQSAEYSLSGAIVIESAEKQAGAPLTLEGGDRWVWLTGAQCDAIDALLADIETPLTLTLHDGVARSVLPRVQDGKRPLRRYPVPVVAGSGVADPTSTAKYVVDQLLFLEL